MLSTEFVSNEEGVTPQRKNMRAENTVSVDMSVSEPSVAVDWCSHSGRQNDCT